MEEDRIPKMVLNGNFHMTRPLERPRTRWADVVQRDALKPAEGKRMEEKSCE
jgi:hypothetical protein